MSVFFAWDRPEKIRRSMYNVYGLSFILDLSLSIILSDRILFLCRKKTINIFILKFPEFYQLLQQAYTLHLSAFCMDQVQASPHRMHLLLQNSSQNYSFKSSIYIQHVAKISPLRIFTIYWMISSKTVFEFQNQLYVYLGYLKKNNQHSKSYSKKN